MRVCVCDVSPVPPVNLSECVCRDVSPALSAHIRLIEEQFNGALSAVWQLSDGIALSPRLDYRPSRAKFIVTSGLLCGHLIIKLK